MNRKAALYLLAEFGPVLCFFITGQVADFFTAASVLMVTTVMAGIISWHLERHTPVIPIISAVFVLVGGGATHYWRNETWLILADTFYYSTMGLVLMLLLWRQYQPLKYLFAPVFAITDAAWRTLTWRWAWFFLLAAAANEYIRHLNDPKLWINYQVVKTIIFVLFATYQFTLTRRCRIVAESNVWGLRTIIRTTKAIPSRDE